jgi:hypothetical protein
MQAIFRLPALDTLESKNVRHEGAIDGWDVPDRSSNIKELHVSDCLFDDTATTQMISYVKTLEVFEYRAVQREDI